MFNDQRIVKVSGVCGVLGVLMYIGLALSDPYIGPQTNTAQEFLAAWGTPKYAAVNMALHFVFAGVAVLWLVSFIGIKRLLGAESSVLINVGTVLGTIACAVMAQMMIIQGSVMSKMGQAYLSAASDSERQSVIALYKGLRFIDYGMDLTFDLFFFTAWILLGISMLGHRVFGKVFGAVGIVLFVLAAFMNFRAALILPSSTSARSRPSGC